MLNLVLHEDAAGSRKIMIAVAVVQQRGIEDRLAKIRRLRLVLDEIGINFVLIDIDPRFENVTITDLGGDVRFEIVDALTRFRPPCSLSLPQCIEGRNRTDTAAWKARLLESGPI